MTWELPIGGVGKGLIESTLVIIKYFGILVKQAMAGVWIASTANNLAL